MSSIFFFIFIRHGTRNILFFSRKIFVSLVTISLFSFIFASNTDIRTFTSLQSMQRSHNKLVRYKQEFYRQIYLSSRLTILIFSCVSIFLPFSLYYRSSSSCTKIVTCNFSLFFLFLFVLALTRFAIPSRQYARTILASHN